MRLSSTVVELVGQEEGGNFGCRADRFVSVGACELGSSAPQLSEAKSHFVRKQSLSARCFNVAGAARNCWKRPLCSWQRSIADIGGFVEGTACPVVFAGSRSTLSAVRG